MYVKQKEKKGGWNLPWGKFEPPSSSGLAVEWIQTGVSDVSLVNEGFLSLQ
jgi:hypothetical protein